MKLCKVILKLRVYTYLFIALLISAGILAQEKRLAVIITTYNNTDVCEKNLESLFSQNYSNYYAIVIDDCSTDKTYEKIVNYVQSHNRSHQVSVIKNSQRRCKMANLYNAIHGYCMDSDIIVEYDGDDWFSDSEVFNYINDVYSKDIWLTHGGYQEYPSGKKGFCRAVTPEVIAKNNFREYPRTTSQLRTFYAWLFKRIKLEDLFFEGQFAPKTSDVAQMMPMFEMAGERIKFNERIVYIYNLNNPINDHKDGGALLQEKINSYILALPKYSRLSKSKLKSKLTTDKTVDLIAYVRPSNVQYFLDSLRNIKDLQHIYFITDLENVPYISQYVSSCSKSLKIHTIGIPSSTNFTTSLKQFISKLNSKYVAFVTDYTKLSSLKELPEYISALKNTGAFAYHFNLKNNLKAELLPGNTYAFQYKFNLNKLNKQEILNGIFNRQKLLQMISQFNSTTPIDFVKAWQYSFTNSTKVSLFKL